MGRTSPTLRRAWPKDGPLAAICVQSVDVQCVLQFTLIHAAGCVLHRRTSRVIHRLKFFFFFFSFQSGRASCSAHARGMRSEPVASNRKIGKMKKAANGKQKKARGRHPSTRPTGLFKPSPTDGPVRSKRKRELPPPRETDRQLLLLLERAGRRFRRLPLPKLPTALLPAREESPTSRASQVPHSHSFSGGGPTETQAGPNFEDVHPEPSANRSRTIASQSQ